MGQLTFTTSNLVSVQCEWCGGIVEPGTTCPRSVPCPDCKGQPGGPCYRPSGHVADRLHVRRVQAAELIDRG